MFGPVNDTHLAEGYAVGTVGASGKYLTVLSSAYVHRVIFPTAAAAQPRLEWAQALGLSFSDEVVIRRVRRGETATTFVLLDDQAAAQ